ncbi:MAG: hypothetical protein ABH878_10185 [bacterium]
MNRLRHTIRTTLLLLFFSTILWAYEQPKPGAHVLKDPERYFRPDGTQTVNDRAVGLLDKGQLSNLNTNYGILSDFHLGTPALHWPREGADVQHYCFGLNLIMVADGNVISSIYDPSSAQLDFGWEATDGSLGTYFNDNRTPNNTAGDGITPFLASSDIRDTWPVIEGAPTWPGYFRQNLDNPEQYVAGEFVSDRDIFCAIQDDYGMGLRIKQTAYSYGRPYAEDFLFIRFQLINEGGVDYDSCYVGFQADLKPDFYADDFIEYWTIEPYDQNPSFFYKWDYNGIAQRDDSSYFGDLWEGPVGHIGIGMVDSPNDLGVTSFHYYHDDESPVDNEYFTAILANNNQAPLENLDRYFHGTNPAFDDPAMWYQVDKDALPGSEITFSLGSGPFALASGDSVDFAILISIGEDSSSLRNNVETAYFMAKERYYQGSGPPAVPSLTAIAGDGQVKLFWDNKAESSVDAISGQADFEGYKLYKSMDQGSTWGEPVTNFYGDVVGWTPLAQFDLIDSITGLDPAYSSDFPDANNWLGDDTGLSHSYTDNDVVNGTEIWYCITAYDRGVFNLNDPSVTEPSYENAIGVSSYDVNIKVVTPGTVASDLTPGNNTPFVELNGRVADGQLELVIVNPADLLNHTYRITFNDPGDTIMIGPSTVVAETLTLNFEDITEGTFYFTNTLTGEDFHFQNIPLTGDDLPIVNGFRLVAENVAGAGVRSLGWTTVNADSSTFDWWTENRHPGNSSSYEEIVEGLDDWRITVIVDSVQVPLTAAGFIEEPEDTIGVHLKVERADYILGGSWIDATQYLQVSDLQLVFPGSQSVGPYGWDLIPGGNGYNPNPNTNTLWPDMLLLRDDNNDTTGSLVYLKTQNGPDTAQAPSVGDVFTIETYKPFNSELIYEFSTQAPASAASGPDLSLIKVVPNPLIVSSGLENNPYETKVMFTHLPQQCEIAIYTVSGNRVVTLQHNSETGDGYLFWDLRNHEGQNVAYGVYVYVVKTPDGSKSTGKLMVIR